jgi:2-polyprenyl-3-methyl-5-hydroxy-6-metoxy-1,4-benzoquinol methylase
MRCPCCSGQEVAADRSPLPYLQCSGCGHRWRSVDAQALARHYATLERRNAGPAGELERKLADREASLRPLLRDGQRILEIGCAEGHLGARIKSLARVHYTGVEPSRDADAARAVLDRVFEARPPAAAGRFDVILSFHVLEHIVDVFGELCAWRDLLTPEGIAVLEVPNGAGHLLMDFDCNAEHVHQFTAGSFSTLAHRAGLQTRALTALHYESALYSDSLRLTAVPCMEAKHRRALLVERFHKALGEDFAVYGVGGDFRNYVLPILGELRVRGLFDADPSRHGEQIGSFCVRPFDPAQNGDVTILVASLRYREEIMSILRAAGVPRNRLVGLDAVYG